MGQGIGTSAKLDHSIIVNIVMWNIAFHRDPAGITKSDYSNRNQLQ